MGVKEISNSNQVKNQWLNKQIATTQKGNRKLAKSCKFASLVSGCLSTNCQRRQVTVKSSEKRLKCKIEPRCGIKSLQVRKELESNIVARHGLMTAKMPAENDFVRFKKMKQSYLVLGELSNIAVAASAQVEETCRNDAIDPESSRDRRST